MEDRRRFSTLSALSDSSIDDDDSVLSYEEEEDDVVIQPSVGRLSPDTVKTGNLHSRDGNSTIDSFEFEDVTKSQHQPILSSTIFVPRRNSKRLTRLDSVRSRDSLISALTRYDSTRSLMSQTIIETSPVNTTRKSFGDRSPVVTTTRKSYEQDRSPTTSSRKFFEYDRLDRSPKAKTSRKIFNKYEQDRNNDEVDYDDGIDEYDEYCLSINSEFDNSPFLNRLKQRQNRRKKMNGQQTTEEDCDFLVETKSNPDDNKASLAEKRTSIVLSLREHEDPPLEAKLKHSISSRNSSQSDPERSGKYPLESKNSKSKSYGRLYYSNDAIHSIRTY